MNVQFEDQVKQANSKLKEIDAGLAKLAIYEAAPYKITDNSLITVDANGNHVIVEYGTSSSMEVVFKSKFQVVPTVVATAFGSAAGDHSAIYLASVTKDRFRAQVKNGIISRKFNWIAIGK